MGEMADEALDRIFDDMERLDRRAFVGLSRIPDVDPNTLEELEDGE